MENEKQLEKPMKIEAIVIRDDLEEAVNFLKYIPKRLEGVCVSINIKRENWEYEDSRGQPKPVGYISQYVTFAGYKERSSEMVACIQAKKVEEHGIIKEFPRYKIYMRSEENCGQYVLLDIVRGNKSDIKKDVVKKALQVANNARGLEYIIHYYDKSKIEPNNSTRNKVNSYPLTFEELEKRFF